MNEENGQFDNYTPIVGNTKKSKQPLIIGIIILLIIGLSVGGYFYYKNNYQTNKNIEETAKPSLKDDFYESINYETLKKAKIPRDSGAWNKVYDVKKTIEKRQEEIVNEILADPNYKNERIDAFIEIYTDYETRNKIRYSELNTYFDMINNAKTTEEFNKVSFILNRDLDIDTIIVTTTDSDIEDQAKSVFVFNQIMGDLNELELLESPKYASFKKIFLELRKKILKELGYDETKIDEVSNQIDEFTKYMYSKTTVTTDTHGSNEKIMELYNRKYTLNDLKKEIKNLPIEEYLKRLKINDLENYIVIDLDQLKAFDEYYTNEHLPVIKEMAKIKVLNAYFMLPEDNEKYILDLNNKMLGTSKTIEEQRKEELLSIKSSEIDDELQKRYEAKYFTDSDKKIVTDLANEIKEYYKEVIKNSNWLEDVSKEEALKKIDKMKVYVGYQENTTNKDDEKEPLITKANGGTIMSNIINTNRFNYDRFSKDFKKENGKTSMNTLEVNAFYDPQDNSINFLAGFKGIYDGETNYYRMMGYFGTVIGHEISHAFDNSGSKYDENGKLRNWWTQNDTDNYKQLTEKIKNYYSKYEYMGFKVNGEKTLGENIADLASMKALMSIAESKGATKEDYMNLFEAYADLYSTKCNKEYAELQSLNDEHAPNKIRVNAVLSSIDKFYEVYDIKEGDKMFVPKEDRVSLW